MQHLDEGTLQAWLDRPRSGLDPSEIAEIERHLAVCANCAARLGDLRRSTERARSLLAVAREPVASAPPYQRIAERALSSRKRQRAQKRLTTMAWAASIVVALGVGWMTNDLYRSGVGVEAPRYESLPARDQAPVAGATEPARSPSEEARTNEAAAAPSEAPPSGTVETGVAAPAEARPVAPSPSDVAVDTRTAAPSPSSSDASVDAGRAAPSTEPSLARAPVPQTAPPPAAAPAEPLAQPERAGAAAASPAAATGRVVVSGLVVDESGRPVSAAQVFVADGEIGVLTHQDGRYSLALPEPADSDSASFDLTVERIGFRRQTRALSGRGGDTLVADFDLKEDAVSLDEVIVTGKAGGTQRRAIGNSVESLSVSPWHPTTRTSAEDALGRPLRSVPGLGILTIEVDEQGAPDGSPIVRVRQALGDGLALTLVEGRSDPGSGSWTVQADGPVESIRLGDLLITGTAPVSADSLRAMLDSLR